MVRNAWKLIGALMLVALVLSAPAQANFSGRNGQLVFQRAFDQPGIYTTDSYNLEETRVTNTDTTILPTWSPDGQRIAFVDHAAIYTIDADGTNRTLVLDWQQAVWTLSWSPDGTRLAAELWDCTFQCTQDIYTMNPDGTGLTNTTADDGMNDRHPSWSPDGTKIAYSGFVNGAAGLYTMNPDGSGKSLVEQAGLIDTNPSWSPDGTKIAFQRGNSDPAAPQSRIVDAIYIVNADGTNVHPLVGGDAGFRDPAWSPDGSLIAFSARQVGVIRPDGTGLRMVTSRTDSRPEWQALPVASPPTFASGYARPKGADRIRASLVPAYQPCTAPNKQHGSPLAFPSCAPPARPAPETVGTPDANGRLPQSIGRVDLDAILGDPGTPQNEADVFIGVKVTDVWDRPNAQNDYTGGIDLRLPIRITDRVNDGGADGSATVRDFALRAVGPCNFTSSSSIGSTCSITTSANAIAAGAVTESNRTIWEVGRIDVFDGGPDNQNTTRVDNRLLFTQGVFVP
jgi:dipeptidyl aminopeptidase/acylaminoacyl peptidase